MSGGKQPSVVLAGAGHANLVVLDHWRGRSLPFRLTVIDPGQFSYSGMATGVIAGDYTVEEASVDPRPLATASGAEFVRDRVSRVDRDRGVVELESGREIAFDFVSLNIGSWVGGGQFAAPRIYPVKPITEIHRLARDLADSDDLPEEVVIAGGGVSGCEIACCVASRLRALGRSASVTIVHAGKTTSPELPPRGRRLLLRALDDRRIHVVSERRVVAWHGRLARLDDGTALPFSRLVLATGLEPNPVLEGLDLPVTDRGLLVDATLRCPGDRRIFAAGDCADIQNRPLPNIGVYGVRAAPSLADNIEAAVQRQNLHRYRPQHQYLSILNLGAGEGLAIWDGLAAAGRWALRLKDWIDRRFMRRFQ